MANKSMSDDGASLLLSLLSDNAEQPSKAPQRRGHNDEWYQERCVFCADCKSSITSQHNKRGSRCSGCRRWFHSTCMPLGSSSSSSSDLPATTAAAASADETGSAGTSSGAAGEPAAARAAGNAQPAAHHSKEHTHTHSLFFHTSECQEVYDKLAAVADAGEQVLVLPAKRGFFPWQQQAQQQQQQHWRLLDLSQVRPLYKDAHKRGLLFKQHAKVKQQLAEQEQQADKSSSSSSSSNRDAGVPEQLEQVRRVVPSRLDDFLVVSELLRGLGDSPKDLLEDSFALITRTERGAPTCAATLNIFGTDHARLQGLATPQVRQRQGHASVLMGKLEEVLSGAGLQQVVVILDPEVEGSSSVAPAAAIERWLTRRLGYVAASSEQHMVWRRDLPEYHRNLTAGCTLLVKQLQNRKPRRWW